MKLFSSHMPCAQFLPFSQFLLIASGCAEVKYNVILLSLAKLGQSESEVTQFEIMFKKFVPCTFSCWWSWYSRVVSIVILRKTYLTFVISSWKLTLLWNEVLFFKSIMLMPQLLLTVKQDKITKLLKSLSSPRNS